MFIYIYINRHYFILPCALILNFAWNKKCDYGVCMEKNTRRYSQPALCALMQYDHNQMQYLMHEH